MSLTIAIIINLHKASTIPVVLTLMWYYQNFGYGPYLYLALHGTYCILWLMKDLLFFPDKRFATPVTNPFVAVILFPLLGTYWIAPLLVIRSGAEPSPELICLAVSLVMLGVFFHFCGDCQKYYTLKYHPGLIREGLFQQSRNINYLGEILIYLAFNIVSQHWLPFIIQALFVTFIFIPNMLEKDKSLSRYEEFKAYKSTSALLVPKLF